MDPKRYDAETTKLIETCMELQKKRDPKALASLEALRKIAEKKNDSALCGFAYFYLANTHYRLELNHHHFRSYLVKAIGFLQESNEKDLLARAYNYVGLDASNNGCYDVSYHYFMTAQRLVEELDDAYIKGIVLTNLGQLYARLGNTHLARQTIRLSLQLAEGREDDLYYFHNLISAHYLDGVFSIRLSDYDGARKADTAIRVLEAMKPADALMGAQIVIHFLRAEIALIDNDRDLFEANVSSVLDTFGTGGWVFDFIEDITMFCTFLIEQNELAVARQLLDRIGPAAEQSGNLQMMLMVTEVEIAYHELVKDERMLFRHLRHRHDLERRRQSEVNRIYFLSIGLIDSMDEIMRERPAAQTVMPEDNAPLTKEETDAVTGLPNRRRVGPHLEHALGRMREKEQTLCLVILNVDRFSAYSEVYGKKAANTCLHRIALELRVIAYQHTTFCARYEGDTFVMVFENMKNGDVMKVLRALDEKTNDLDGGGSLQPGAVRIALSMGACNAVPTDRLTASDYVMEAYAALHEAKRLRAENNACEAIVMKKMPKSF